MTWGLRIKSFFFWLNGMIEDPTLSILYLTTNNVRCTMYVVDSTEHRVMSDALHIVNDFFLPLFEASVVPCE